MTRLRVALVALLLAAAAACGGGSGGSGRGPDGELTVLDAFLPEPPLTIAALYLTLDNRTGVDDRLLGATTPMAGEVMVHGAGMEELAGLPVPAGEQTVLEPGGAHLMLLDTEPVRAGELVEVVLSFDQHEPITIEVPVAPLGATEAP